MLLGVGVVAVLFGGYFTWSSLFPSGLRYRGLTMEVKEEYLQVMLDEEGALEAANNNDIVCKVQSNKKGSAQIKIKEVKVEDGNYVKEGQLLVELDDTPLQNEYKDQDILVQQAEGARDKAIQEYEIVKSQNKSDIATAETTLKLAIIEEEKYKEGDYYLAYNELKKKLNDLESDFQQWQERASYTKLMFTYGYVSKSQVDADSARSESANRAYKNALKELDVLNKYTSKKMSTEVGEKKNEAERALNRAKAQAAAKDIQAKTEVNIKTAIFSQEDAKLKDIKLQINNCKIYSPADGLCIYYVPPQSRWGRGSQQSILAQGEPVEYNQKLMQIPDLSKMIVKARIPQAMVKYLRNEDPNYPEKSQKAFITVDGYADQMFHGHVRAVATIADQQDFLSSDVKVYVTEINIDEKVKDLKPGMSSKVSIRAYKSPTPVLTIPIQAVVGSITMGKDRKCFVIDEKGNAELRDIVLGLNNEHVVEVKQGLKKGEKVALDPSALLTGENNHLKASKPGKNKNEKGGEEEGGFVPPGTPPGKGKDGVPPKGKSNIDKKKNQKPPVIGKEETGGGTANPFQEKQFQQFLQATPQERRNLINAISDANSRDKMKKMAQEKGLEIAD